MSSCLGGEAGEEKSQTMVINPRRGEEENWRLAGKNMKRAGI